MCLCVCDSDVCAVMQTALKLKQKMFKEDWAFFKAQRRLLEQTLPKHKQTASDCHSWYITATLHGCDLSLTACFLSLSSSVSH